MALSPMMRHHQAVKEEYPDCIVFYRLGDFYEMFFEDAITASAILDLTLTGRDCGLEERAPMCGVPYHAAEGYIAKLVQAGKKVAVCEQLSDPATTKGMVERGVVRVVSAGTLTDDTQLNEKENNFISMVFGDDKGVGLAWADITTGEFFATEFHGEDCIYDVIDRLTRLNPAEIFANYTICNTVADLPAVKHHVLPNFQTYRDAQFSFSKTEAKLKKQFEVLSLSGMIPEGNAHAVMAAGALVFLLEETQKRELKNLREVYFEEKGDGLVLDYNAIRNLELIQTMRDGKRYGSVLWLLDKTKTGMGARKLASWLTKPLNDVAEIELRQSGVEELTKSTLMRQGMAELLSSVKDLSRLSGRVANNNISPRDALALGKSLSVLPSLKFQLATMQSPAMAQISASLCDLGHVEHLLLSAIDPENTPTVVSGGGFIANGFSKELDELKDVSKNGKTLLDELERREREKTGIKNLKIAYNRVFGYYLEVTNSYKELVPYYYQRKQTTVNAERYITEDLKILEDKILSAQDKSITLEITLFEEIKKTLLQNLPAINRVAEALATLDCLLSLATVAKENRYVKPEILPQGEELSIVGGRHPVVEAVSKDPFVANDTYLNADKDRTMIITGPNMAGKSTYMRQVALIAILAHMGSFVPAKVAKIPILDKVYTRVGASDNLILDQSTFMVEMSEVAAILRGSTQNSLLILDEVGRGTSTYDGLSIAWAVVEHITKFIRAKTLFATHYHELTEIEGALDGVKNYKITVKEMNQTVVFLRKIARGGANKSFGVEVASLAGVPQEVTKRAKEILKSLEKNKLKVEESSTCVPEEDVYGVSTAQQEVLNALLDTDPSLLTPLQALTFLDSLVSKIKSE
ncbi:MAG: DNA mismatch repair protein MutS [Clostridiales bacterium]|nr:DNA mismatch repair protein MutS [Clostridiales bacterium]